MLRGPLPFYLMALIMWGFYFFTDPLESIAYTLVVGFVSVILLLVRIVFPPKPATLLGVVDPQEEYSYVDERIA